MRTLLKFGKMFCSTVVVSLLCAVSALDTSLIDDRIVGGKDANIIDYPYQVSFQRSQTHFCGGSLISTTYVLTAAHCIKAAKQELLTSLQVRVGSRYWASSGTTKRVASLVSHPKYDSSTMVYDVGLVKLVSPLVLTDYIKTIKLASVSPLNGTKALISGWGATESGSSAIPGTLQAALIYIISKKVCSSNAYSYSTAIMDTMMCGGAIGKDSCQGDSGGPLVNRATGELVGVVSWGSGCANQAYPGVYANVAVLKYWITTTAGLTK